MRASKILRICGVDVTVKYSDPGDWAPGGQGRANTADFSITIKDGLPKDCEATVLLHEVIHTICSMNGLSFDRQETEVSVLATSLTAFLRDNDFGFDSD